MAALLKRTLLHSLPPSSISGNLVSTHRKWLQAARAKETHGNLSTRIPTPQHLKPPLDQLRRGVLLLSIEHSPHPLSRKEQA